MLENEIDITFLDPANYFQFFSRKKNCGIGFTRSFFYLGQKSFSVRLSLLQFFVDLAINAKWAAAATGTIHSSTSLNPKLFPGL